MSVTFTKLFSSITESTVWCEPDSTRIVWITMLAMADRKGRVWGSIPGLANRARVTIEQCENALITFKSPDRYSRTPDFEGRRIEDIDGGWFLLNYAKHRDVRDEESIKESKRNYINKRRAAEREAKSKSVSTVEPGRSPSIQAEAEAEAEAEKSCVHPLVDADAPTPVDKSPKIPNCPHQKLIDLFHAEATSLPRVMTINEARKVALARLWKQVLAAEQDQTTERGLEYFEGYFNFVEQSDFLTGRAKNGKDWSANFDWIIKAPNFVKIIEGTYHRK